jgi:hypothetical protein
MDMLTPGPARRLVLEGGTVLAVLDFTAPGNS